MVWLWDGNKHMDTGFTSLNCSLDLLWQSILVPSALQLLVLLWRCRGGCHELCCTGCMCFIVRPATELQVSCIKIRHRNALAALGSGGGFVHRCSGDALAPESKQEPSLVGVFLKKPAYILSLSCMCLAPELWYFTAWLWQ